MGFQNASRVRLGLLFLSRFIDFHFEPAQIAGVDAAMRRAILAASGCRRKGDGGSKGGFDVHAHQLGTHSARQMERIRASI
jgi:hypothetical protein